MKQNIKVAITGDRPSSDSYGTKGTWVDTVVIESSAGQYHSATRIEAVVVLEGGSVVAVGLSDIRVIEPAFPLSGPT